MLEFWKNIRAELLANERIALLYVLQSKGSSPGRQGFHQFVSTSGFLSGSIGGGVMEKKLVEYASTLLKNNHHQPFLKHQVHQTNIEKNKSGMICSGEQTIAFYFLNDSSQQTIELIISACEQKKQYELILNQDGLDVDCESTNNESVLFHEESESKWFYRERLNSAPTLFIIGGGHVGLALSRTMYQLEFEVHVVDDRSDLNTMTQNEFATKHVVADYVEVNSIIPSRPDIYIVIMTTGYRSDLVVLRELLIRSAKYIGLLGSKEKIKRLFAELSNDGVTEMELRRVHAPIGLNIHSKTPNEIAVSIAAQIIQVKNEPL
jgi:xanthine dehydrogenase accessory factor